MRKVGTFFGVLLGLAMLVACGDSDVGEKCEEEGRVGGECVNEAVCGKSEGVNTGSLVCLRRCGTSVDCSAGEECGTVGFTSLRGCRTQKP